MFKTAILTIALLSLGGLATAQNAEVWGAGQVYVTRQTLESLLERYEQTASSGAHSQEVRARARQEAALIRYRLEEGDFQVGDQIQLAVAGEDELTNTFTVGRDRTLLLPVIGPIPLDGVLRAELEPHLAEHIGRKIIDPVINATPLIRISILGSVGQQGFYVIPSSSLLTDAITQANGLAGNAELGKIYIERDGERIWGGEALQDAITEGRTLDQLGLQAGDQVHVPGSGDRGPFLTTLRTVGIVAGATWAIIRIFRFIS